MSQSHLLLFVMHHWWLVALFIVLLVVIINYDKLLGQLANISISPQQLVLLMNRDDAIVIDIRHRDAFCRGHIIGAHHLAVDNISMDHKLLTDNNNKNIVIVGNQEQQTSAALRRLQVQKLSNIKVLAGGFNAWQQAGLPLTRR